MSPDDPTLPPSPYAEDIDETFGAKPRAQESDADRLFVGGHEHNWVTPRIALGSGMWSERDVAAIRAEGITHVLDCRVSSSSYLYVGTSIVYLNCPTDDDGEPKDADWFRTGVGFAMEALRRPDTLIMIHCAAGLCRSPAMVYALLRSLGHSESEAELMIRKVRIVNLRYKVDAERARTEGKL